MGAAIAHIFGVDTTLIGDRTYFVAEIEERIVGCGGWSQRRKLFGGDQYTARDAPFSEPSVDPARIARSSFIQEPPGRESAGSCSRGAKAKRKLAGIGPQS